jgi:hypothetical protein
MKGSIDGAAYFIVLNADAPGFNMTVDGKALARHSSRIDSIATELGFKTLGEYCSLSPEEARAMMADLMELEDENDLPPAIQMVRSSHPSVGTDGYDAQTSCFRRDKPAGTSPTEA